MFRIFIYMLCAKNCLKILTTQAIQPTLKCGSSSRNYKHENIDRYPVVNNKISFWWHEFLFPQIEHVIARRLWLDS